MDFGGLDDILDYDMGYIPTAIKRDQKPRSRPASMSRQNSSKSIGSVKDGKEDSFRLNQKQTDSLYGLAKQTPRDTSFNLSPQPLPNSGRRSNLFSLHKQTAQQNTSPSKTPISFEDFFKTQNTNQNQNIHSLSKPPLPEQRTTIPERRLQKNSSFTQLSSPENIIDDDLNNSSVASRRGRPPLSRRTQQTLNNQNDTGFNKSQSYGNSNVFLPTNDIPVPVMKNMSLGINQVQNKTQQSVPNQQLFQSFSPNPPIAPVTYTQAISDNSIQQLKKLFSTQMNYQKQMFQTLIKQQRQNNQSQKTKLKQFHKDQLKKKLEIKDFEIQKMKEFYQLQLKIQTQRQSEVKQYNSIAKKLQGNIEIIEKLQRNIKQNQSKDKTQRQEHKQTFINKKQFQFKEKQNQLKSLQNKLQQQINQVRNQKLQLNQQINTQKNRLYQLQIQLRNKQTQLLIKYKKLQNRLNEEYQNKRRMLERQKQQIRIESLHLQQQKNIIEIEKLQVINTRKMWDNEKKAYLEQIHQQKTKVLEKEIQIASRTGKLQIQQQQIQMNQNDYMNKLKIVDLQKKRFQIEKKTSKGQFYNNMTLQASGGIKTNGLLGTTLLNKTSQSALNKDFYSNQDYQREGFEQETNYKKSITQMRDQFLKSLPKF